jgi:DEAD/DEAH box helicase
MNASLGNEKFLQFLVLISGQSLWYKCFAFNAQEIVIPIMLYNLDCILLYVVLSPLNGQIIIGTPGTVQDWSFRYQVIDLKKINVFVLDEADVMIDTQGHQDQSLRIQR